MLKSLNNILKRDKEPFRVPRSVQDTIPITHIWENGIWQVGNKYSQCWQFTDINFLDASEEDKRDMVRDFRNLINALDDACAAKFTTNNLRINKTEFEQSILLPMQNDNLDVYRREYNDMILSKVTENNNSIIQERFVTISIQARSYQDAKNFFIRINPILVDRFAKLDSVATELNTVRRLRTIHNFFRQGEEAVFENDLDRIFESGNSFRDYICPDSLELFPDYFRMGERYGRSFFLKSYGKLMEDDFVTTLCSLNRNLFFSMDLNPVPMEEAVREIEAKLLAVETNITNWQRRQNENNNFTAVIPYDLEQQRNETTRLLNDLKTRNQRLLFGVITMVISADTKEELDRNSKLLTSLAQGKHCQLAVLRYQQLAGLNTALPYGQRNIDVMRTLTSESAAIFMPFCSHEIMDAEGTYCGINTVSSNLIIVNRKALMNGNGFILGVSGSGKSFFSKREILFLILSTGDDVIIMDPQNEYTALVQALGGTVINLSPSSPNHINCMDLAGGYGIEADPLSAKADFVLSFIEQIMGKTDTLHMPDKSLIDRCLHKIYADYIASGYQTEPPTLVDLYQELKQQKEKQAKELALALEMVSIGSLNMFAHPTNVNVDNRLISFGIRDLGQQLRTPGMLVMTDAIRNRVARNRERGVRTHVIMDEMHIFFANELSAQFFEESWKQFRKDGALATGITQNVEDCLQSDNARKMLANSEYLVLLNQAPTDLAELTKLLHLKDAQMSHVKNVGFGQGLLKCGSNIVPFFDRFPTDTKLYRLMSTKPGEQHK